MNHWYAQGSPSFFFGDVDPPHWCGLVLLRPQLGNLILDDFHAEAIQCLAVRTFGHVPRLTLQPFVGHDVQCWAVEQPVQVSVDPLRVTTILLL